MPTSPMFLVAIGVDAMSLHPDTVLVTTQHVLVVAKRLSADAKP